MGYFPEEKINKYAPGAECVPAMKIWKLPDGKEYMFAEVANSGDYFATIKKDGYWYEFEKTDDGVCYMFSRTVSKESGILSEKIEGLDCVSFGPQNFDIHTPQERLNIESTERVWNFLVEYLKQAK